MSKHEKAQRYVEAANGALLEGDVVASLSFLIEAEQLKDDLPELHHTRALAYFQKKEIDLAIQSAKIAVNLKPDYSDANTTLGKLLADQGNFTDAIPYLKKAASDPLYRDAFKPKTQLGIGWYQKNQMNQAITFLNQAVESDPVRSCIAYFYRGKIYEGQAKLELAIRDYEKATQKFCGGFGEAQFSLGQVYIKRNQLVLAKQVFLEIRKQYPETDIAERAMEQLRKVQ